MSLYIKFHHAKFMFEVYYAPGTSKASLPLVKKINWTKGNHSLSPFAVPGFYFHNTKIILLSKRYCPKSPPQRKLKSYSTNDIHHSKHL